MVSDQRRGRMALLRKRIAQAMVGLVVVIGTTFATSSAAHAACFTPTTDPNGVALPPQTQTNCSTIYYWDYDSRGHVFAINVSGQPIHTWQVCADWNCAYNGSWVGLGGWASSYYNLINYTDPSGRKAIEVSVYGSGGTKYCKNYNGNYAG